jgi:hypothetical protein
LCCVQNTSLLFSFHFSFSFSSRHNYHFVVCFKRAKIRYELTFSHFIIIAHTISWRPSHIIFTTHINVSVRVDEQLSPRNE